MRVVDGDSHFMEPLDLFERYIDPAFRDCTLKLANDPATGKRVMVAGNKPLKLRDVDELLYLHFGGGKEPGRLQPVDRSLIAEALTRLKQRVVDFSKQSTAYLPRVKPFRAETLRAKVFQVLFDAIEKKKIGA